MSFEWWENWWDKSIIKKTTQSLQNIGNTLIETITNRISIHDKDHTIPKVIERHYNKVADTIGRHYNNWKTFIQELLEALLTIKDDTIIINSDEKTSRYGFHHNGKPINGTVESLIDQITKENIQSITDTILLEKLLNKASEMKDSYPKDILRYDLWDIWHQKLQEKIDMINNQLESREAIEISTHRAREDESSITPTTVAVEANVERWMVANPSLN